jgi:hypothetical protein
MSAATATHPATPGRWGAEELAPPGGTSHTVWQQLNSTPRPSGVRPEGQQRQTGKATEGRGLEARPEQRGQSPAKCR